MAPGSPTDKRPLAVAIVGPTASGKSALAMQLAQHLVTSRPCEIISVDSAQVFRHMDVGTAKPSAAEQAAIPHHLLDLIDPPERYSAAQFCQDAVRSSQEILARGNLPLLVGGTMLYLKALLEGLSDLPDADPAIRAQIEADATQLGWPALHARLATLDPEAAARLHPTDSQRIERALEIIQLTGKPLSQAYAQRSTPALPFRLLLIGLAPTARHTLHDRIALRFNAMLKQGLIDEVRELQQQFALTADLPSMRCVGYRQTWLYLAGDYGKGEAAYEELRQRGIFATRQLAKRQLTWMNNSMPGICLLDSQRDDLLSQVLKLIAAQD